MIDAVVDRTGFVSLCQKLLQAGRATPDRLAVVDADGSQLSLAGLLDAVVRMVLALQVLGVRPGQRVALECTDRVVHLTLILACQAIGAASLSCGIAELQAGNWLTRGCDLILTGDPAARFDARRRHDITPSWLRAVRGVPVTPLDWQCLDRRVARDEVVRIPRTSGTTGTAKAIRLTASIQMARIERQAAFVQNGPPLTYVTLYNLTVEGNLIRCCRALIAGAPIQFVSSQGFLAALTRVGVCHTLLLVADAEAVLRSMPPDWTRPERVVVSTGGAAVPARLRAALLGRLATEVHHNYSSNETSQIALIDPDGVGVALPDVTIAIRDDSGAFVDGAGEGRISVRSPSVAAGYLDNPELDRRYFSDGWFHTTDWGFMPAPGKIVVLGRADGMLNIGGRKIPAERIEAELCLLPGVSGAAMVSLVSDLGVDELAVMLEVRPNVARDAVDMAAAAVLEGYSTCRLALVSQLPRTETRKVRRTEVIAWFRERARDKAG